VCVEILRRWFIFFLCVLIGQTFGPAGGSAAQPRPRRVAVAKEPAAPSGHLKAKLEALRKAGKEKDANARHSLGLWCLQNNLPKAAASVLEEAIALDPGNLCARFHLARAYVAMRQYAKGKVHLDETVRRAAALPRLESQAALEEELGRWRTLLARKEDASWSADAVRIVREILVRSSPVRIFVDRSTWAHGWDILEARGSGRAPNHIELKNYDRIKWDHLRHADVCAILTKSMVFLGDRGERINLTYLPEEVEEIRKFVGNGGGLLLGGDGAQWRSSNRKSSAQARVLPLPQGEMPLNKIAEAFGIFFTDRPINRADAEKMVVYPHPCFGKRSPEEVAATLKSGIFRELKCGHPSAQVLARDGRGRIVAVAVRFGTGHVLAIGTHENWCADMAKGREIAQSVCQWLGSNRMSIDHGQKIDRETRWFESSAFVDEGVFRITYNPQLAYKVPAFQDRVRVSSRFVSEYLGVPIENAFPDRFVLRMLPAFGGGASGAQINVAVLGGDENTTGILAHEMTHRVTRGAFGHWGECFSRWMGIQARQHYGEREAAAAGLQAELDAYRKADPSGSGIDLGKAAGREAQGKAIWVFKILASKYGDDIFKRYLKAVREDTNGPKTISIDDFVRYMSQAANEDLRPWFKQIGTRLKD